MTDRKTFFRRGTAFILSFLFLIGFSGSFAAGGKSDSGAWQSFLDDLLPTQLERYHVPGAVVAIVKDGAPFTVKGYGVADLESGRPVEGNQTLFRIASVTKLFTWTAVMQLTERGLLDLV